MDPLYDLLREADVRLTAQESDTALSAELQQWAQSPAVITSPALREVLEAISARLMAVETNNLVSMPPK
jgi:HD-like signal output (HDOD) protein